MLKTGPRIPLFLMRVALGGFMLLWGLDKLVNIEHTKGVWSYFYATAYSFGPTVEVFAVLGTLQIILSLAVMAGLYKTFSYGLVLVLHFFSVASTWPVMLAPFDGGQVLLTGVPLLFAYLALFLMRDEDTLLSVEAMDKRNALSSPSDGSRS